jgi:hypothetical protein
MGQIEQEKIRQQAARMIHSEVASELGELKHSVRTGGGDGDIEASIPDTLNNNHAQVAAAMRVFLGKALASGEPQKVQGQINAMLTADTDNKEELTRSLMQLAAKAKTVDGAERIASEADFLNQQQQDTQRIITSIQDESEALGFQEAQATATAALPAAVAKVSAPQSSHHLVWYLVPAAIAVAGGAFVVLKRRKAAQASAGSQQAIDSE